MWQREFDAHSTGRFNDMVKRADAHPMNGEGSYLMLIPLEDVKVYYAN